MDRVYPYTSKEMPRLLKTAAITPGTRVEVYWPHESAWCSATIEQERTYKRENYLVSYNGKKTEREWIDLHRHKIRIPSQQILTPQSFRRQHSKELQPSTMKIPQSLSTLQRKSSSESSSSSSSVFRSLRGDQRINEPTKSSILPELQFSDRGDNWNDPKPPSLSSFQKDVQLVPEIDFDSTHTKSSYISNEKQNLHSPSVPIITISTQAPIDLMKKENPTNLVMTAETSRCMIDEYMVDTISHSTRDISGGSMADNSSSTRKLDPIKNFDEAMEGIILDPSNDPATMSAVYSLIEVGSRVSIYWEHDQAFFDATVTDRKQRGKPFFVEYDDGDEEWIDLRKHKLRLIPPSSTEEDVAGRLVGGKCLRKSTIDASISLLEEKSLLAVRGSKRAYKTRRRTLDSQSNNKKIKDSNENDNERQKDTHDETVLSVISKMSKRSTKSSDNQQKKRRRVNSDGSKVEVGSHVAVWWDGNEQYFNGHITAQRKHIRNFLLEYDDGKKEWINLAENDFKLLPPCTPQERKRRGYSSNSADPDDVCIGVRVAIWWDNVKRFHNGIVTKKRRQKYLYFVEYDNDDESGNWIDFEKVTFQILDDGTNSDTNSIIEESIDNMAQEKKKAESMKTKKTRSDTMSETNQDKRRPKQRLFNQQEDCLDGLEIAVGTRVAICREGDSQYYEGKVTKERKRGEKRHYLEYDDGETAHWIDFKKYWVRVLPDQTSKKRSKEYTPDKSSSSITTPTDTAIVRAATTEIPSQKYKQAQELAKIEIGKRVQIWWAGDECYFSGTVKRTDLSKNRFYVKYDDGNGEWVDSRRQLFYVIAKEDKKVTESVKKGVRNTESLKKSVVEPDEEEEEEIISEDEEAVDETLLYDDYVYGEVDLVKIGSKISIWWPGEKRYFEGKIKKINKSRKPYFIKYVDGDEEWTDLKRRYFRLL